MKLFYHDLIQLPKLSMDYSHNYTISGKSYPSVTSMLSATKAQEQTESLQSWRDSIGESVAKYIFRLSAKIGTETHKLNEDYLSMRKNNHTPTLLAQAHHRNFMSYLDKIERIYAIEARLYSDGIGLAGTADCVGMYDGKPSIIDYKTKRSEQKESWMTDYFIQTAAYSIMWEELTKHPIEQLVILVSSEQGTMQEFVSKPEDHKNSLYERINQFKYTIQQ